MIYLIPLFWLLLLFDYLRNRKSSKMRSIYFIVVLIFLLSSCRNQEDSRSLSLRLSLDEEIAGASRYVDVKESRLDSLKSLLRNPQDVRRRFETIEKLISEYDAYKADSALYYINLNLESSLALRDSVIQVKLLLKKADLYSHAGLFSDALDIMEAINPQYLSPVDREQYFANYCSLYQYMYEYNTDFDPQLQMEYERKRRQYADSIKHTSDSLSLIYTVYVMPELAYNGKYEQAIKKLKDNLISYPEGSREYSILASILAYVYKISGNREEYMEYLTRSAISDVKGAIKENMSFREMATNMYEKGDIDRANVYLKKSIADANFFSARMRNAQSLRMLPMIDEAYDSRQRQLYHRLEWMVEIISLMALVLVGSLYYIRRQYKRLKVANANVAHSNEELSHLSEQLRLANNDLAGKNVSLNESNVIKEQYTGLFMEYCATAVNALQRYHQSLRLMANQGISKAMLQKKLESSEFIDSTIKEFYAKFDEAILNIYPEFPEKVNALLREDEQVKLKPGEILNTELRIQALIRIGISENAKIAEFLRCSITTIYTYRSKLRRRTINPDTFETDILSIS